MLRKVLGRLFRGIFAAFGEERVQGLVALTLGLIFVASGFYWYFEGWSVLDSVYFSVITIATVGYGDLAPQTAAGKIFTILYVFCGLGIFVAAASAIAEGIMQDRRKDP
ncbi:two pore domain potassium channel family protein [Palleronia sediminis]|uniref:Two pore domain potassium channel family protein n=1 Tax=Palleronia sediminis TaxID=2547833 RepID=A0A4R6A5F2_9RHOB|nr:potassium channel family protein [Palleronia sediminis]TDL78075.1 two pore domain potassium channel family protein [Palleronia sediminis]